MIKVVLLGVGNLAHHLIPVLLNNKDIELVQIYNRTLSKISSFEPQVSITDSFSDLCEADVYIISVADQAIEEVSNALQYTKAIVLHTSGASSLEVLKKHNNIGVFYPLQTFSKDQIIDFQEIPILIEASNTSTLHKIRKLATSLSDKVIDIDTEQRKIVHLSAVLVNNFVNHLFYLGFDLLEKNNIPSEILNPLIQNTVQKLHYMPPYDAQTGPAVRQDLRTINQHLTLVKDTNLETIYHTLTHSILEVYGKKL